MKEETQKSIIEQYQSGKSFREIAKLVGVGHTSVRELIHEHGLYVARKPGQPNGLSVSEMDCLIKEYTDGKDLKDIAKKYDIDKSSVLRCLKKNGIAIRGIKIPEDKKQLVIDLYQQGRTSGQIEKDTGVGKSVVCKIIKAAGIKARGIKTSEEKQQLIIEYYRQGKSFAEIGKLVGVSDVGARNIVRRCGAYVEKQHGEFAGLSSDEIRNIAEDYSNGEEAKDLVGKYQTSMSTVYRCLRRAKVEIRGIKIPEDKRRLVVEYHQQGKSFMEISRLLGISGSAATDIVEDLGIYSRKSQKPPLSEEEQNTIRQLLDDNWTIRDIAIKLERNEEIIRKFTKENGLKIKWKQTIDESKIIESYHKLQDISSAARECGVCTATVYKYLSENKILYSAHLTDDECKRIIDLYNSGLNMLTISKMINHSDLTVRNILLKNNITLRPYVGSNTSNWKGGVTDVRSKIRGSEQYNNWRKHNFQRTNYRSEISGINNDCLEVHHIFPLRELLKNSWTKHHMLSEQDAKYCVVNDGRFYDLNNGLVFLEEEHKLIESAEYNAHPWWRVWSKYPEFALLKSGISEKSFQELNESGLCEHRNIELRPATTPDIRKTIRYEHYLGTISPSKLILVAYENDIIAGVATFGRGANRNLNKKYWELTRLCVPHYVVKPFACEFINMCCDFIKENYPDIKRLVSYADTAVGHNGGVYRMAGWDKAGKTPPSYMYYDPINFQLSHKSKCRRIKGIDKSEEELAKERGLVKIITPPKLRYIKEL